MIEIIRQLRESFAALEKAVNEERKEVKHDSLPRCVFSTALAPACGPNFKENQFGIIHVGDNDFSAEYDPWIKSLEEMDRDANGQCAKLFGPGLTAHRTFQSDNNSGGFSRASYVCQPN